MAGFVGNPLRVVALGGAGGMGRHAARAAAAMDCVGRLVVADRDGAAAEALARSLGPKARSAVVNVTNAPALRALLAQADVVLNTVGPFFRFGVPVLQAAIDAGCAYADVCDDWEPTLEMLDLDARARARGVTAVVGMGVSPGVANLLAVHAAEPLDRVDRLLTGWALDAAVPETRGDEPSAATVHGLHQLTGRIRVWRAGEAREEAPLQPVRFELPGRGSHRAWTIGHPEAVTLPRRYPGLRECLNIMHAPRLHIAATRALAGAIDRGWLDLHRAARWGERLEGKPHDDDRLNSALRGGDALPPLFALAEGEKNGIPTIVSAIPTAAPPGGMGAATGVPLALVLPFIAGGQLQRPGVHPPETILDPGAFFEALAPHCGVTSGEALVVRTVDPAPTTG
jgi:saccharopine dehydrogenase-like NADP-dependent oxidoreductase